MQRPALVPSIAAVVLLGSCLTAQGATPDAGQATTRSGSGKLTYRETGHGHDQGQATLGIVGHGTFSMHLGGPATFVARMAQALTGIPVADVARGGSYVTRYDIDGSNTYRGLGVARFASKSVGTLCFSFVVAHGKLPPGGQFLPAKGTFTVTGGTGLAAMLRLSAKGAQSNVTGASVEMFSGDGKVQSSLGAARAPSAACRAVAKLG